MKLKNLLIRLLFCLPFIAIVLYIHSYHGELINNAQVQWQYLENDEGKVYLALDVYAPSGIKIDDIYWGRKKVTDSWMLINYPDWYKGEKNCAGLSEFQDVLNPYLPYNDDFSRLYTTGWYTFLYEWNAKDGSPMPDEKNLRVKYRNMGTDNVYYGKFVPGVKVFSTISKLTDRGPVFEVKLLYPVKKAEYSTDKKNFKIICNNLVADGDGSEYLQEKGNNDDPNVQQVVSLMQMLLTNDNWIFAPGLTAIYKEFIDLGEVTIDEYTIYVKDKNGITVDSLNGHVRWDKDKAFQVFSRIKYKTDELVWSLDRIDFSELSRHIAAVIFMLYFAWICRCVGLKFIKLWGGIWGSYLEKLAIPFFLGFVFLTYLFFIVGIFKLLYFPVLFVIFLVILLVTIEPEGNISEFKRALANQFHKIRRAPWRLAFWLLLGVMLFYNFSFCFVPSTVLDGSTDIMSNYRPLLNYYIQEHSFAAPVQNSYIGLLSQSGDVLRTVAMIFAGETGLLLLSFIFLLGILVSIYLICKKVFKVKNMLIYISLILFLSSNIFTEVIHLGKVSTIILSFYLMAVYCLRYSEHEKNYVLASLFFAFTTAQYAFLAAPALVFYFFAIKTREYNQLYKKGLVLFLGLSCVFYIKLIIENGVCFPPGMIPEWLADIFLKLNQNNAFYRYIDNNYIRFFQKPQSGVINFISYPMMKKWIVEIATAIPTKMIFSWTLVLTPFLLRGCRDRNKRVYLFMSFFTIAYFLIVINNPRTFIYYLFVALPLQVAMVDKVFFHIESRLRPGFYISIIVAMLFLSLVDIRTMAIRSEKHWYTNLKSNVEGIRYAAWGRYVLPVFCGLSSQYAYLYNGGTSKSELKNVPYYLGYLYENEGLEAKNYDYGMLIMAYTCPADTILITPEIFHGHSNRTTTAISGTGSVIFQKDISAIISDFKKLNINYLSVLTVDPRVTYGRYYTPIFKDDVFYKYFKLLFSYNGRMFYKIIHDGTNTEYFPTPIDVEGLPFIPMMKEDVE